jgi:hypothetical protein
MLIYLVKQIELAIRSGIEDIIGPEGLRVPR